MDFQYFQLLRSHECAALRGGRQLAASHQLRQWELPPAAPDDWVRVKHGLYKGDLARVLDVDYSRDRATIQIVPRLDYAAMAKRQQEGGRAPPFGGVQPGKARPPQR